MIKIVLSTLFSTFLNIIYIHKPKKAKLINACPLGKLSPDAGLSNGSRGLGLPNNILRKNISNKLENATEAIFMANHLSFKTKKTYTIKMRLAGTKNWCEPKKVKNDIIVLERSEINLSRKLKTRLSNAKVCSKKTSCIKNPTVNNAKKKNHQHH